MSRLTSPVMSSVDSSRRAPPVDQAMMRVFTVVQQESERPPEESPRLPSARLRWPRLVVPTILRSRGSAEAREIRATLAALRGGSPRARSNHGDRSWGDPRHPSHTKRSSIMSPTTPTISVPRPVQELRDPEVASNFT
jgi:hypothetical protein